MEGEKGRTDPATCPAADVLLNMILVLHTSSGVVAAAATPPAKDPHAAASRALRSDEEGLTERVAEGSWRYWARRSLRRS
jgi:hypothetical protein